MTPAELVDIEACRALIIEFAARVDTRQTGDLRELFVDEATFTRPSAPGVVIQGVDAIIASFATRPPTVITQHMNMNIRVKLTGPDSAESESVVLLFIGSTNDTDVPGKGRPAGQPLLGTWSDRFVRTAAGWRFTQRRGLVTLHGST
jgi:hypothetical protein